MRRMPMGGSMYLLRRVGGLTGVWMFLGSWCSFNWVLCLLLEEAVDGKELGLFDI